MLKRVSSILLALTILVALCGCTESKTQDAVEVKTLKVDNKLTENEYNIGDKTVYQFMEKCRNLIKAVYAPEDAGEFESITSEYSDIINSVCLQQLLKTDTEMTGLDYGNDIVFKSEKYGYGKHQEDGRRKLLYNIAVSQNDLTWEVFIELSIDENTGKIYDIDIW